MEESVVATQIRVLVVDDSAKFRNVVRQLLTSEEDIAVVGEAGDGAAALVKIREVTPDVVLMDCSMPGMGGVEATRLIRGRHPRIHVIGLSNEEQGREFQEMRAAGAEAVIPKAAGPQEIGDAIRTSATSQFPAGGANQERRSQ
jgi:DNA-binding NarL/FixJ family response regulator